jgi:TfoX/Sxy family transcriptional regulator of competence genes
MAYDEELADRVRDVLAGEPGITEKRMFGGLAFLVDGHMGVSASSRGGLLVRVERALEETLLEEPGVGPFEMRGRPMSGWLHVSPDAVQDEGALERWVGLALSCARTLEG